MVTDDPYDSIYGKPRTFLSGGGGLVSTMGDYARFCEMLRRGGELDGTSGARAGDAAVHDPQPSPRWRGHRRHRHRARSSDVGYEGVGFGLGFATTLDPVVTGVIGSAGDFYWGGAASTIFWVDPIQDLFVIFMVQLTPSGTFDFRSQLKALVYPAIV